MHNDIKPQNYLVKFRKNDDNLSNIEIVLTDFGLAGSDLKGGTPVFASPECWTNPNRKHKSSDIFSLGRVFLMMILPKDKFFDFLFVPITQRGKKDIIELIEKEPILHLISKMMRINPDDRIKLEEIRKELIQVSKIKCSDIIKKISKKIDESKPDYVKGSPSYYKRYMDGLKNLS